MEKPKNYKPKLDPTLGEAVRSLALERGMTNWSGLVNDILIQDPAVAERAVQIALAEVDGNEAELPAIFGDLREVIAEQEGSR